MPAPKTPERSSGKTIPPAPPGAAQPPAVSGRKPWRKKTPVEVVLEQEHKLREEIAQAEEDLKAKRSQLQKFEQARKLFESA